MKPRCLLLLLCLALATSLHGQDTNPIHDFLTSPIQSVRLNSGNSFYRQDTLRLTANKNGTLRAKHALLTHFYRKAHYEEPYRIKCQRIRVQKNVRSRELYDILADIDRRSEQMPSIAEFNITSADKERFVKMVAKKNDYFNEPDPYSEIPIERLMEACIHAEDFYSSVSEHIDTVGAETMSGILYKNDEYWFSTGGADWFKIQIINEKGDSLLLSNSYVHGDYAWFLPWDVTYHGLHFKCYLPALSQWVNGIIPKKFYGKKWFDNARFLMQAARYLWLESLKTE